MTSTTTLPGAESSDVGLSLETRLEALRETKMRHTQDKWEVIGAMDFDDHAIILPPEGFRRVAEVIGGPGILIRDVLYTKYEPESNHPSGGFFGARACGRNFRRLLEMHPVYVDAMSSLAGAYMVNFLSYRDPQWNPDFDFGHLAPEQKLYGLSPGIGAVQHFCQDMTIGFELGWGGLLDKIDRYRQVNTDDEARELYDGLEDVVRGFQHWIGRHAVEARRLAACETDDSLRANLEQMAEINEWIVDSPPRTFREAVQWMCWYQMAGKMYNMGGSLGRIDQFLYPYFRRDIEAGILTEEEAVFHLACHFIMDTSYTQLGGPDAQGDDLTNELSYLVLEAVRRLRIPVNLGVAVGRDVDPDLARSGMHMLFEQKTGVPKFLGVEQTAEGFARNGYPIELGRERAYAGCHWCAIPGREYTMNDCVRINFASVFDVAFREMVSNESEDPSIDRLWGLFESHLRRAVEVIAEGIDFHLDHMYRVFPELHLDLLCQGPIEKGRDASHGGLEFYNLCVDGAGLATVADSFAALEQRIEIEGVYGWHDIERHLDNNWQGTEGERCRLRMKNTPRFGRGGSLGDVYARRISSLFSDLVTEKPTPNGFRMIPGLFSWAAQHIMGKSVRATPNGRRSGETISHGPNPDPGFRKDGAPTALAIAVADVQPGFGNTAPMQIELDPGMSRNGENVQAVVDLVRTHFELGGTQVNMNIVDKERILKAHEDPSKFPDLVVRVTGFSAYFASLSPEMRQMVVDRILEAG
jgi:formate C-acetyltransferase